MSDKKNDAFGDKVKAFESASAKVVLDESQPMCVRLDGKAFHTFTRGLARPYDKRLSGAMVETMNYLVKNRCSSWLYTK